MQIVLGVAREDIEKGRNRTRTEKHNKTNWTVLSEFAQKARSSYDLYQEVEPTQEIIGGVAITSQVAES